MHTASDFMDMARPRLDGLVVRAERASGSRMLAYGDVARTIGTSASWVRKMLRRDPVGLPVHIYANIVARYDEACERIEHEAAVEKARFLALGRVADAVVASADRPGRVAQGADLAGDRGTAALVAPLVDAKRERLAGRGRA